MCFVFIKLNVLYTLPVTSVLHTIVTQNITHELPGNIEEIKNKILEKEENIEHIF